MGSFGAEGSAESDFAASFDDVEQCGVGDRDCADEERESGQGKEQRGDVAGDLVAELFRIRWDEGLESFGMVGAEGDGRLAARRVDVCLTFPRRCDW